MLGEIPQASIFLQMGVKLNIRAHQNKIFGEITCQDNAAEIIASQSNMFQTGEIKAQGAGTLHAFTAANIKDIYTKDLNAYELIEKAINFKLHFNSKSYNLRGYIDSICGMLEQQITSGLQMSSKLRNMILLARVGGILRDFSWDLKFSPTDILDCLILSCDKENIGEEGFENLSFAEYKVRNANDGEFSQKLNDSLRNKFDELVAQGQAMREMIPPEFLEIFKSINTEKIELQFGCNTAAARTVMKISLNLPGLNSVKDLLLN